MGDYESMTQKATQGDIDYAFILGKLLANGADERFPQDLVQAKRFLAMAASKNHSEAQLLLAQLLLANNEKKVEDMDASNPEIKEVNHLLRSAISYGHGSIQQEAEQQLAFVLLALKQDEEALRLFEKGAANQNPRSLFGLGLCYLHRQNYDLAIKYFEQAAKLDEPSAQYYLVSIYYNGEHVPVNKAAAFKMCHRAAEQLVESLFVGMPKIH